MSVDLDQIRIAKPCGQSWAEMEGDDRVRNCASCELCVFNISEMTRVEAAELIESRSGRRLCIRLHRRADGTVIARAWPTGDPQKKSVMKVVRNAAAAASLALVAAACSRDGAEPAAVLMGTPAPNDCQLEEPAVMASVNPELMVEVGDFCEEPGAIAPVVPAPVPVVPASLDSD